MNVKQAYTKYKIPPNLQKHMLRVSALSEILSENWNGVLSDTKSLTLACLFHDMANIIKFNFDKPMLFNNENKRANYWKNVQKDYLRKYGQDVHRATLLICKELDLPKPVLTLIAKLEWNNTLLVLKKENFVSALSIYCDMRIGPFGILPLKERLENLQTRNQEFDIKSVRESANLLEKTLQKHITVDINMISNSLINKRFARLLKLDI